MRGRFSLVDARSSYSKTVFIAAPVFGAGLGLAVASGWFLFAGQHSPLTLVLAALVSLGLLIATGWLGLVLAGGLIAIRRDTLESRGVPYAPRRRREWLPGPGVRAVRSGIRGITGFFGRRPGRLGLRPGEVVEVLSLPEILATLDEHGTVEGTPFMPEMVAFCGRRLEVYRRIDKLNDWVDRTGLRRLHSTVHLGVRCDGSGHDGCQARCAIRWKEAWLKRLDGNATSHTSDVRANHAPPTVPETLHQLARRRADDQTERYVCQATQLSAGSTQLAWGDPRHYWRDFVRGNIRLRPLLAGAAIALFNWVQQRRGGAPYPFLNLPQGKKATPSESLNLQPGEMVRVKRKSEIEATLSSTSRNRGLWFDVEMVRHCGATHRVHSRVGRLIEEQTGKARVMGNPCIILEDVNATGEYLGFDAQNEAIIWREIWLERVPSREV
jgi:hypothetical protein